MKRTGVISIIVFSFAVLLLSFQRRHLPDGAFLQSLRQKLTQYNQKLPAEKVYLHLDKPFYKPGEDIWLKAYLVNGDAHTATSVSDIVYVELINPKGNVEKLITLPVKKGSAHGDFHLDEAMAGGLYRLRAYTQWMKNFGEETFFEKEIQIQKVLTPRVLLKLEFAREAYGPADRVEAKLDLKNLENQALANQKVQVSVQLAGKEYQQFTAQTDRSGTAQLGFDLPGQLHSSDGLLTAVVEYEGKTESISRSIPIVLNKIDLQFFPEGGELVENVRSKVAFKALNEFGKPADVAGEIRDSKGKVVGQFSSFHQGMGAFLFVPQPRETYTARLTNPRNVAQEYALPAALPKGYVLVVDTVQPHEIRLRFHSPVAREVHLVAQTRGKIYYSGTMAARTGVNSLAIPLRDFPAGITQLTLFDHAGIARCERLVFTNPHKKLRIDLSTDKSKYRPREAVELTIRTFDEDSLPVPANLSLAVVDDKLLSFADDKSDNLPSYLLMSSDLKGKIEEPSFYFRPDEPKATPALDLVLMTHGWRRFAWKEVLDDERVVRFYPEKTGTLTGTVFNTRTREPQPANVTLVELGGQKRVARLKTGPDGSFVFLDVDPASPVQIFAEAPLVKHQHITLQLDQQGAQLYGKAKKGRGPLREEAVVEEIAMNGEVLREVADEEEIQEELMAVKQMDKQNIALGEDVKQLSEVVVIGYGEQRRMNLTGAIVHIDANELGAFPYPSPEQALQGRAAGIQVSPAAPAPNEGANLRIYGMRSLASDGPLFVVDGYPVERGPEGSFSSVGFLSPDEIKSIEVLKSPAGAAYYGSGGANGVVIITTKRGDYRPGPVTTHKSSLSSIFLQPRRFTAVREFYSPQYTSPEAPAERTDFRSTIYWNPDIRTDDKGRATVRFYNSDEVTAFRATVEGLGVDGLTGRGEHEYFTQLPFSLDAKIPPYLTFEDQLEIPVFLKNNTEKPLAGKLSAGLPKNLQFIQFDSLITLQPGEARTVYLRAGVLPLAGTDSLRISFAGSDYRDALVQEIEVRPKGFPSGISVSDRVLDKRFSFRINEPLKGSIKAELKAYPDVLSDLMSGIESILQEPYGCFEQTSSSTYPNILVLQYLQETGQAAPETSARALKLIQQGYRKLVAFETKETAYEWFGQAPAHEGLSAYGLTEFTEMQKVYNGVDQAMIARTADWLLSRRDGKGGFKLNPKALDQFGRASQEVTNAYLVYSLTEAGYTNIRPEFDAALTEALASQEPYRLALMANACFNRKQADKGEQLLALLRKQSEKGGVAALPADHSIVRSSGKSLQVETASLYALALLKAAKPDIGQLQAVVNFLVGSRSHGGFGSTQATILALKALTEYAKFAKQTAESGTLQLYYNNRLIASRPYEKGTRGEIVISGIEQYMQPGEQQFRVVFADTKEALPYSLNVSWTAYTPNSSKDCKVDVKTDLAATKTTVGKTLRLTTTLRNKTAGGLPMTVALVGIPSGLSPQPWQLKELQEKRVVDYYEVRKNYVVFYYRELAPNVVHRIHLDLKAEVPGTYQAPASTAYLYYTNEYKTWAAGERVEIKE